MNNFAAGTLVRDASGVLGIVTEPVRKSGPNKGKVAVQFRNMSYQTSALPEDLTQAAVDVYDAIETTVE